MSIVQSPDSQSDRIPPLDRSSGIAEFNLLALGTRGAGKTVFLSALYNQMKDSNKTKFLITTDPESRNYLLQKYDSVKRPDKDWPPPNAAITRYVFDAIHKSVQTDFPLFKFTYLDFPGGYVTGDCGLDQSFDIQAEVKRTHSLIVLIDGLSILRWFKGINDDDVPTIFDDVDSMSDLINTCVRRPLQFVVTKSDILLEYSLDDIRDLLFKSKKFHSLISARKELELPTHLIGVSAVGNNFATCDPKTGIMTKRLGMLPEPYNIDLTLSLAVTDTLLSLFKQSVNGKILTKAKVFGSLLKALSATEATTKYAKWLVDDPWLIRLVSVLEVASQRARKVIHEREEDVGNIISKVTNFNSALNLVLEAQQFALADYAAKNPASNLLK